MQNQKKEEKQQEDQLVLGASPWSLCVNYSGLSHNTLAYLKAEQPKFSAKVISNSRLTYAQDKKAYRV